MNWTQKEAAEMIGCSKRSIANWEFDPSSSKIPKSISLAISAVMMGIPPYKGESRYEWFLDKVVEYIEAGLIIDEKNCTRTDALLQAAYKIKKESIPQSSSADQ